jgi:cytochrome c peroxidase
VAALQERTISLILGAQGGIAMHPAGSSGFVFRGRDRRAGVVVALVALFAAARATATSTGEPIEPLPLTVDLNAALVQLGERLFADPNVSHGRTRSCASCHPLDAAGVDGQPRATAATAGTTLRNTPTIFNVGFNRFLNWDGATERLEPHDERVLLKPALMGTTWKELLERLSSTRDYAPLFAALPSPGVTRDNVLAALASYERSLVTPNSRFDRYLRGERSALSAEELQGYLLFKDYGCVQCHQGINIGGNLLQKFGVFTETAASATGGAPVDQGRFDATGRPRDRGVFRVPSLRNVAVTAPYFHDGRAPTLEAAVYTMARVQLGRDLAPEQIRMIVAFLGTLTGEYRGKPLRPPAAGAPP